MPSATPSLEDVIAAVKTEMEAVASVGTVLLCDHGYEDDVEAIVRGGYLSGGSMDVSFIDVVGISEQEGAATGELYELYQIEVRKWCLRTGDANWSKTAREKAEAIRDALANNPDVFAIDGQYQLNTPQTVQISSHGQFQIRGGEGGDQMVYRTVLSLTVEARRWGGGGGGAVLEGDNVTLVGVAETSDVLGAKVSGDAARRWNLNANGLQEWGDGSAAYDVSLGRGAAGRLDLTGNLRVTGLTASRLLATDASKVLTSVSNLTSWVAGTTNQVSVADDGDGTITLSAPQNIHSAASPTFAGLTLSGLTASQLVVTDGSKALASVARGDLAGTADQVSLSASGTGVLVGTSITLSLPQSIATSSSPTFAGATFSGLTASSLVATDGSKALTSTVSGLSPTFTGLTLSGLSASSLVATDGSKALTSSVSGLSPTFTGLTLSGLTALRLMATDGSKAAASTNLVSWIDGTSNQISVADNGDGSVTLSTPQNIHTAATVQFGSVLALNAGGGYQFRAAYDGSNYADVTVDSSGYASLMASGDRVVVNSLTPWGAGFDIAVTEFHMGAQNATGARGNAANKTLAALLPHYTNASGSAALFLASATTSANTLQIGGGSASYNALTSIQFYTGATSTTTTGTVRWRIEGDGHWIAGSNNAYDIGDAAGLNRPRTIYAGTSVYAASSIGVARSTTDSGVLLHLGTGGTTQAYIRMESAGGTNRGANLYIPSGGGFQMDTFGNSYPIVFNGSNIKLYPGATNGWDIGSTPHLIPSGDNAYDLASSSLRVRTGYFGTQLNVGTNTFSSFGRTLTLESASPGFGFYETGAAVDEKAWDLYIDNGILNLRWINDAITVGTRVITVDRTAHTAGAIILNEDASDIDVRIESPSNQYAIYVDGGLNSVSLLTSSATSASVTLGGNTIYSTDNSYDIGASGATRPRTGYFGTSVVFGTSGLLSWSTDLHLTRDAANVFAQKNGTTAQSFRVYGTTTGPKYTQLNHDGSDGYVTSNSGALGFIVGSTLAAYYSTGFHHLRGTDNAYDEGQSGANRPRTIYVGTSINVVAGAVLLDTNGITMGDAKNIILNTTTGTKIGTAATQKLSLWNATPIVQPTGIADADGTLADITTKFNSLLSKLESMGALAVA